MTKAIAVPAQIIKIETKSDNSIKITAVTMLETTPEESTILFSLRNKSGYMAFSESMIKEEVFKDLPEVKPEFAGEKSPAQRMRAALFVWWEQTGKQGEFELFYRRHYERMIDQVKEKLN